MMAASFLHSGIRLSELLRGWIDLPAAVDCEIAGLALDSRQVAAGYLFLACAGTAQHGMAYLRQAVEQGASAVLYEPDGDWALEQADQLQQQAGIPVMPLSGLRYMASAIAGRFYGEPGETLSLIGFTGTNGKTSCTQFLAQALEPDTRCGVVGTLGSGFLNALKETAHTTPDPVQVQAQLAEMRDAGAQVVAMEVSSHALDQGRVEALAFDVAVLTNLSRDHLDYHQTMEEYAAAKQRLFTHSNPGCAVLNLDDAFGQRLQKMLEGKLPLISYSLNDLSNSGLDKWLGLTGLQTDSAGMLLQISSSWGTGELRTPLLGRFNASNLLAVLAVLLQRGLTFTDALQRLARVKTVPGRMERFGKPGQPLVVVDYAHTPDALEQALKALRAHTAGRLICLFGCGGDRDKGKRREMGRIAEACADLVFVTDDNPRSEPSEVIIADILTGVQQPGAVQVISQRDEAISAAIQVATTDDVVLVAGKGHEDYQLIGDLKMPFSDREKVAQVLVEVQS
ncbi:MAG: UDP-N-acetylmuramoyl-L-alanyl-D-glutamate--2,6-diaminopimelate ligase [Chromatiales bacterium]|nr:UDP-N-acetylmuramoyl-L-alanyl-D-glutamate--2,6-diaminopimelate ligase [Chromatiales bacterium]